MEIPGGNLESKQADVFCLFPADLGKGRPVFGQGFRFFTQN